MNNIILPTLLLSLVAGIVAIILTPKEAHERIRFIAVGSVGLTAILSLLLFFIYDQTAGGYQFVFKLPISKDLGLQLLFAADGLNIPMFVLTGIVGLAGVFTMWRLEVRVKEFFAIYLFLLTGILGSFLSFDLFFFFLFFEIAVLPMYLLITIWGSKNKEYAAMKLTIYLLGASCLVITGFLMIYHHTGLNTFNLIEIMEQGINPDFQSVLFLMLFFGFGVLAAVFPFHTWSPDGYAAAPTAASMVHAGVLKQLGAYAILRFAVALCPEGASQWSFLIGFLAVCNIVYAGVIAAKQNDLKYVIGYSSVAHMGVVLLGIADFSIFPYKLF